MRLNQLFYLFSLVAFLACDLRSQPSILASKDSAARSSERQQPKTATSPLVVLARHDPLRFGKSILHQKPSRRPPQRRLQAPHL